VIPVPTPDGEIFARALEFPGTNGQVSALGLATFYNALAQEKLISYEHMDLVRASQGAFDTDLVPGPRVADHGWASAAHSGLSIWNTGSDTPT
jgi:hypothetical protein